MKMSLRAAARALLVGAAVFLPASTLAPSLASAQAALAISINIAPPPLPVYEQPPLPAVGYIWTPGYWAWDNADGDYFWVPGAWVAPPRVGLLWTPGYWSWSDGAYVFNEGFWGTTVGFYGGIDYGYGYTGEGYYGGRWENGRFAYNRSVTNIVNVKVENVYDAAVPGSRGTTRVSFNGGNGGTTARPTPEQSAAAKDRVEPTARQMADVKAAEADPRQRFKTNHGKPAVAANAGETQSEATRVPEAKPAQASAPEAKPTETRASEPKSAEDKTPEAKPTERRAATERMEPKAEAPRMEAPRAEEPARNADSAPRPRNESAVHANAEPRHAAPEGGKGGCGKPKCD